MATPGRAVGASQVDIQGAFERMGQSVARGMGQAAQYTAQGISGATQSALQAQQSIFNAGTNFVNTLAQQKQDREQGVQKLIENKQSELEGLKGTEAFTPELEGRYAKIMGEIEELQYELNQTPIDKRKDQREIEKQIKEKIREGVTLSSIASKTQAQMKAVWKNRDKYNTSGQQWLAGLSEKPLFIEDQDGNTTTNPEFSNILQDSNNYIKASEQLHEKDFTKNAKLFDSQIFKVNDSGSEYIDKDSMPMLRESLSAEGQINYSDRMANGYGRLSRGFNFQGEQLIEPIRIQDVGDAVLAENQEIYDNHPNVQKLTALEKRLDDMISEKLKNTTFATPSDDPNATQYERTQLTVEDVDVSDLALLEADPKTLNASERKKQQILNMVVEDIGINARALRNEQFQLESEIQANFEYPDIGGLLRISGQDDSMGPNGQPIVNNQYNQLLLRQNFLDAQGKNAIPELLKMMDEGVNMGTADQKVKFQKLQQRFSTYFEEGAEDAYLAETLSRMPHNNNNKYKSAKNKAGLKSRGGTDKVPFQANPEKIELKNTLTDQTISSNNYGFDHFDNTPYNSSYKNVSVSGYTLTGIDGQSIVGDEVAGANNVSHYGWAVMPVDSKGNPIPEGSDATPVRKDIVRVMAAIDQSKYNELIQGNKELSLQEILANDATMYFMNSSDSRAYLQNQGGEEKTLYQNLNSLTGKIEGSVDEDPLKLF